VLTRLTNIMIEFVLCVIAHRTSHRIDSADAVAH